MSQRLSVIPNVSTKDGTANKNARLTNMLKETRKSGDMATIRPGLVLDVQASGLGNGLVSFHDELVSVYGSTVGVGSGGDWTKVSSEIGNSGNVYTNGSWAFNLAIGKRSSDGTTWAAYGNSGALPEAGSSRIPIGSDWYGIQASVPRVVKSTDNWDNWTAVANLPAGAWAGTGGTLAYANSTLYAYDGDDVWQSSDLGLTWGSSQPAVCGFSNGAYPFYEGGTLYLFDATNRIVDYSTDFVNFTEVVMNTSVRSIGYYSAGLFYGYCFYPGDGRIFTIPANNLSATPTIIGTVSPDLVGSGYYQGVPFFVNNTLYVWGVDGIYARSIPTVGTVSGANFDFAESPL